MQTIMDRLAQEPVVLRTGIAAVLNLLVVAGLIDVGLSDGVLAAILGIINIVLIVSARQKVTPVDKD